MGRRLAGRLTAYGRMAPLSEFRAAARPRLPRARWLDARLLLGLLLVLLSVVVGARSSPTPTSGCRSGRSPATSAPTPRCVVRTWRPVGQPRRGDRALPLRRGGPRGPGPHPAGGPRRAAPRLRGGPVRCHGQAPDRHRGRPGRRGRAAQGPGGRRLHGPRHPQRRGADAARAGARRRDRRRRCRVRRHAFGGSGSQAGVPCWSTRPTFPT